MTALAPCCRTAGITLHPTHVLPRSGHHTSAHPLCCCSSGGTAELAPGYRPHRVQRAFLGTATHPTDLPHLPNSSQTQDQPNNHTPSCFLPFRIQAQPQHPTAPKTPVLIFSTALFRHPLPRLHVAGQLFQPQPLQALGRNAPAHTPFSIHAPSATHLLDLAKSSPAKSSPANSAPQTQHPPTRLN